jgi:hypothetical protein
MAGHHTCISRCARTREFADEGFPWFYLDRRGGSLACGVGLAGSRLLASFYTKTADGGNLLINRPGGVRPASGFQPTLPPFYQTPLPFGDITEGRR